MRFDPKRRVYITEHGRVVTPAQVKKIVDDYIEHERLIVKGAARYLFTGDALVDEFFALMRQKVTGWHAIAGTIAYGGDDQMTAERWARINSRIVSELAYLEGFQTEAQASFTASEIIAQRVSLSLARSFPDAHASLEQSISRALMSASPSDASVVVRQAAIEVVQAEIPEIALGPESGFLMGAQIEPRASMYVDAIWATHEVETLNRERDNGVNLGRRLCEKDGQSCDECVDAATEEFIPLDDLEEIGSLQCLNNCRCEFEFSVEGVEFATSELFQGVIGGQDAFGGSVTIQ